ncbi:MAG TPA: CRTAC1 family protein [Chthonomonadaceae bacterium]|nr:CRTAC1 family protein [Chthonomonadaceae bacterium]
MASSSYASPSPAQPPVFAEITTHAGLHYQWTIPGSRPMNILQTIGNGCAFLDYNNDGNLDILLVGTDHVALYQGDGHGHFTDVSRQTGLDKLHGHFLGCAVGDYDNDGFDDIYLSAYRGGVLLHNEAREQGTGNREQGTGNRRRQSQHPTPNTRLFRDVTQQAGIKPQPWGTSAAFADIDGSGRLSLYIGNYVRFGPSSPQLCRIHQRLAACGPIEYPPEKGVLYRNLGNGKFEDVTRTWGGDQAAGKTLGVAFADYDGTGRQSLALANDEMAGNLFQNQDGKWRDAGTVSGTAYDRNGLKHGGMGIDWGDYDNDGRLDLLVGTYQQEVKNLYHNDGALFTDRAMSVGLAWKTSPYVTFGAKFLDADNDGWLDIILTNGHTQDNAAEVDANTTFRQPIQLFHNRSGAAFDDISAALTGSAGQPIVGRGLAIGDFDNDGRMDVLVVESEGAPLLLHNETPNTGHWLEVKLQGVKSNRDGIGALVTFEAAGRKLLRLCHTDGSYMSASDRRVHCGLGAATSATVQVKWTDGHQDTYKDIPADQIITLWEGN